MIYAVAAAGFAIAGVAVLLAAAVLDAREFRPGFRRAVPTLVVALAIAAVLTAAALLD
ncbi:hypothetical protein [Actinacidiphila glaucinigra]|uniref:hypothetical protein n=1 Tax=Actinacidiphila glaucinigra TaxID=235986 RepID=UPI0035DC7A44